MKKVFLLLSILFASSLTYAESQITFARFGGFYRVQKVLSYSDRSPDFKTVNISVRHLSLGENVIALEAYSEDLGEGHYRTAGFSRKGSVITWSQGTNAGGESISIDPISEKQIVLQYVRAWGWSGNFQYQLLLERQ